MSDYVSLGDAITRFLKKYQLQDDMLIQSVLTEWEKYVGAPIAAHTEKLWFDKGILYVKVSSPAWKNELMMARTRIRLMINEKLGKEMVNEVKVL